ncbi:MAG: beta-galactosidase trimerization domain-containing protein [Pedobacter sp.]|nr:beta-galactosidase trimerization domain-containing protein [Pedobacter sp.]
MMFVGAEIFIEPGQTDSEIYSWFELMQKYGLGITRIRMFESYMRKGEVWDFSLFDVAFEAAEKYQIKVYANLFPETNFSDVGGFKFPKTAEHLGAIANYIHHVVQHFNQFNSLYGWVPINEPGSGSLPEDDFTKDRFQTWKDGRQKASYNSNGFTTLDLSKREFLVAHNIWFLKWLTQEIRKYDKKRPIHVNNHDIFKNAAEYDFPNWREFLTSLGGSAHASWHFDYFSRNQFAVAMSANAEILRSGAGPIPWFMTELQGGNNTYSGKRPLCPTKEEIAQWLWVNVGSGSEGGMFWCMNARRSGFEAGEWAMLDFQNKPTDRLLMASCVSKTVSQNHDFFADFSVQDSRVSVLYTRESLWIEQALHIKSIELEGRMVGGVMKSALSYFEALSEIGVHASFKEIGEYNFELDDFTGQAIILSHQLSIPSKYWRPLNDFVYKGGKLIVDGLTAYYDENAYCILGPDFPFKDCFGALINEFKFVDNLFDFYLSLSKLELKSHLWRGTLKLRTATSISKSKFSSVETNTYGCRNDFGKGHVVWIPSLLGLGSRISGSYKELSSFLRDELSDIVTQLPVSFETHQPGMLLKLIRNANRYMTVLVNKSGSDQILKLNINGLVYERVAFSSSHHGTYINDAIAISSEETMVVEWRAKV